ncbi:MAG: lysophospholipase [Deltaproteobacteria bacterium]|nr:lysophospholipase [Deltaproteobacteria bacterium]MBW2283714.1 lysophospholipase [Deltaproteobacteria bacterium]
MNHREGTFKGVRDARIYYQGWLPEGDSKAALLVVHGLAEHSGRYANLVRHFVPPGYAVYGLDHLGHGKSDGTRVYVDRFSDYLTTLKIYVDMVREWEPERPVFLVGHSMGGLIGALFLLDHQEDLAGAVLSGPSVKVPDNISGATIFVGKVLSALLPKAGLIALEAEGICRDPAVVEAYVNDPLVYTGKTTARLGAELLNAMQRIIVEAGRITLPLLIVQGGADRLVDPAGATMLFDKIGSADKEIKVYDDFYHEVFNEPEHERVLGDVEAWLEKRLNIEH